jgi:hypothetical protein
MDWASSGPTQSRATSQARERGSQGASRHRKGSSDVRSAELGALGFTAELGGLSERVKTLPNHHCLYKTASVAGEVIRGLPFYELMKAAK